VKPLAVSAYSCVNALGHGRAATLDALRARRGALAPCTFADVRIETHIGMVPDLDARPITGTLAAYDCRNNRLALAALDADGFRDAVRAARERYGPARVAVILGTSTSGIFETEEAYRRRDPATGRLPADFRLRERHNLFATADFTRRALELAGHAQMISTACSSSAKAFAAAARMIEADLCDAAVVGGVDSLCRNTLYGFASLELTSREPCRPCDSARAGISLGEAAGFALLEREARDNADVALLGYGESSDAYHMATPDPEGRGALLAMQGALESAGLAAKDVDYINMHGTATVTNDAMEDRAIARVFGKQAPASSTKGWTGHTLGAAGITEAIIAMLCIRHGLMPGCLNTANVDPAFESHILLDNADAPIARVLSNSFGFGGSNCSLVFGRA
jgi:3-oxoacyl-[acyl-carrier-protein] synthase-1